MDPTFERTRTSAIVTTVIALLCIPITWYFALDAIPAFSVVRDEPLGNRMGPWVFTWVLIWLATISGIVVTWLCYKSMDPEHSVDSNPPRDAGHS